jgi:hypothetical protein
MAKIKLTKILKEGLDEAKQKERIKKEMDFYAQKMDKSIEKLRSLMRKDGYSV